MTDINPEQSPEHRLGMAMHLAFTCLDEIMAMAADPETTNLVKRERVHIGQLISRAELIAQFALKYPASPAFKTKMVSHG